MARRPWTVVLAMGLAGAATLAAAGLDLAAEPPGGRALAGLGALLVVSILAARYPVPLGEGGGSISLGLVFAVAAIVLFGWAGGVLVGGGGSLLAAVAARRRPARAVSDAAALAVATFAAGAVVAPIQLGPTSAVLRVAIAFAVLVVVERLLTVSPAALFTSLAQRAVPCSLMASAALVLVVLWQRSPPLSAALVGPLLAIALYQRSQHRALDAMRLALTDPLTGLGNQRHFQERLHRELLHAQDRRSPLSLCIIDVDDFKRINDRWGHPVGDEVLTLIAARLRHGGEAFRLGGDEFAVLLPGARESDARQAAASMVARIAGIELPFGRVTVSAGVAALADAADRDELVRLADEALYRAKSGGKNRISVHRPGVVRLAELRRNGAGPERQARYRAAATLARASEAQDAAGESHAERLAELAARVAGRLGLDPGSVELVRLAATLHDVGKVAVPEEILRKPGPLTEDERSVLERHPQIGSRMLETLGEDAIATWVRHHHERWDGRGYPDGLPGARIPLGARIIFVADAFHAMTTPRAYRPALADDEALAELARCSGTQFDPDVVAAFAAELRRRDAVSA